MNTEQKQLITEACNKLDWLLHHNKTTQKDIITCQMNCKKI